jgi:catechol 2,3-dioxygenase-like lactoylglutathione lyase family enzyme
MEQRVSIITLGVSDLQKFRAFYVYGLGWKQAEASNDSIIFVPLNGIALALYQHEALAEDACVPADRSSFRGFTLAYNTRSKEEVNDVLAFAKAAGATITKPAQDVFWGGYSGYFADPDGFLWEVAHNPFVEMTGDGNLLIR